jgi:hypothetical protein
MPKCRICKQPFTKIRPLQPTCNEYECKVAYATNVANKAIERKKKAEKKVLKEKTKTLSDYLKELQVVFNRYIRLRDANLPCICCNKPYDGNFHASHYFSVGHFPHLRFNELNVHGGCVECNVHKHGNTAEYSISLPNRIGIEKYEELLSERKNNRKFNRNEVEELIIIYKQKIKELIKN